MMGRIYKRFTLPKIKHLIPYAKTLTMTPSAFKNNQNLT